MRTSGTGWRQVRLAASNFGQGIGILTSWIVFLLLVGIGVSVDATALKLFAVYGAIVVLFLPLVIPTLRKPTATKRHTAEQIIRARRILRAVSLGFFLMGFFSLSQQEFVSLAASWFCSLFTLYLSGSI
jgi:hypothetical protein